MKTELEFQTFFDNILINSLQSLENKRIEGLRCKKQTRNYSYILGLFMLLAFFLGQYHGFSIFISIVLFLIILFIESMAFDNLSKTFLSLKKDYKYKIIPEILSFLFDDFEYIPNQKISKSVFEKSLLFHSEINVVQGEDFMRFRIAESEIMFCESKVYGYPPVSLQFDGVFISASFNKNFSSKTFIFPEINTSFWRKLKFKTLGPEYQIKLEDPEFEKEFIILGENQIESRYILTPSLMERILEYKRKLNCEISLSFVSNRLYCTIPNSKDLFEPSLESSFLDYNFIFESYKPIILYTSLIEDLNLNLRIWSKN